MSLQLKVWFNVKELFAGVPWWDPFVVSGLATTTFCTFPQEAIPMYALICTTID